MQLSGVSWNWHSRRSLSALFFPRVFIVPVHWGDFMVICTIPGNFLCESLQRQRVEVKGDDKDIYIFFLPLPSLTLPLYLFSTLRSFFFFSRPSPLRFAHPVACCCELLEVVAQNLKPVKLLATCKRTQQLPAMLRPFARSLTEILEHAQPRRLRWSQ